MVSRRLRTLAREYLDARKAQERDYTDPVLDWKRTEAHDALMLQMDIENIPYRDREHAAEIARLIVVGQGWAQEDLDYDHKGIKGIQLLRCSPHYPLCPG